MRNCLQTRKKSGFDNCSGDIWRDLILIIIPIHQHNHKKKNIYYLNTFLVEFSFCPFQWVCATHLITVFFCIAGCIPVKFHQWRNKTSFERQKTTRFIMITSTITWLKWKRTHMLHWICNEICLHRSPLSYSNLRIFRCFIWRSCQEKKTFMR